MYSEVCGAGDSLAVNTGVPLLPLTVHTAGGGLAGVLAVVRQGIQPPQRPLLQVEHQAGPHRLEGVGAEVRGNLLREDGVELILGNIALCSAQPGQC